MRFLCIAGPGAILATSMWTTLAAGGDIVGLVLDAETRQPVPHVAVHLERVAATGSDDSSGDERGAAAGLGPDLTERFARTRTDGEGRFRFSALPVGARRLTVSHVGYRSRILPVTITAASVIDSVRIELVPFAHPMAEVLVSDDPIDPSFPISVQTIRPRDVDISAGNIANDPLRTLQAQPSTAAGGIDFNSETAIRGGDPEEHRVYLDDFPLYHYAHVGGFAEVVSGDFIDEVLLIPGAAPLRYRGNLSGIIRLSPVRVVENRYHFRYDITALGVGLSRSLPRSWSVLASAKSSFFNLPVYQQIGVKERSFRDLFVKLARGDSDRPDLCVTLVAADDEEVGTPQAGVTSTRRTGSLLLGGSWTDHRGNWRTRLRPYVAINRFEDGVSSRATDRDHRLHEGHLVAEVERLLGPASLVVAGQVGAVDHDGFGGSMSDHPFALSTEGRLFIARDHVLVLGGGGSREPWTERFEPEAYGSLMLDLWDHGDVGAGFRRSHQTPFRFTAQPHFATIPIDPGTLYAVAAASRVQPRAARMDQLSVSAELRLPGFWRIAGDLYERRYEHLTTWEWDDQYEMIGLGSDGSGSGSGYELEVARRHPRGLVLSASVSRARVWKREGTLRGRRVGDYDRPRAWRLRLAEPDHGI